MNQRTTATDAHPEASINGPPPSGAQKSLGRCWGRLQHLTLRGSAALHSRLEALHSSLMLIIFIVWGLHSPLVVLHYALRSTLSFRGALMSPLETLRSSLAAIRISGAYHSLQEALPSSSSVYVTGSSCLGPYTPHRKPCTASLSLWLCMADSSRAP